MKLRLHLMRWLARVFRVPLGMLAESPWMRVLELPDTPEAAYLWVLGPSSTQDDVMSFHQSLNSLWIRERGHEPRALHVVVRHPVDLQLLTAQEVRVAVKPWLKNKDA